MIITKTWDNPQLTSPCDSPSFGVELDGTYGNYFQADRETAEPTKRLHKTYDAGEMPEEQDGSQPVAPGTVNSGGHNGKRLHPGGKYYPHQTEPKKKALQKEREETRRLTRGGSAAG